MSLSFTKDQKRWLDDYCNDLISDHDFQQLEKELMRSPGFRKLARSYLAMESNLTQDSDKVIEISKAWTGPAPAEQNKKSAPFYWAAAAALCFLLGIGAGEIFVKESSSPELSDDGIATIEHAAGAIWEMGEDSDLTAGSILSPGPLRLSSGLAQLEFYNGAQLILKGPVDLEIRSVSEVLCHSGKLRAFIPETAQGFTILSSQFELVDLGTEFGVEISSKGQATVQVFDGEVELYPPDGSRSPDRKTTLLGGDGMAWDGSGKTVLTESLQQRFPSFEEVQIRNAEVNERRYRSWQNWNRATRQDPRLIMHYDFEPVDSRLSDSGPLGLHGRIVGSEHASGRWPEKGALEFKRPGDRVRLEIPGEFDQLTLASWIRVDALTGRTQALLLTDGYEIGRVHWQIANSGSLRLGVRLPSTRSSTSASGYGSPPFMGPRRIGTWTFVSTVYDRKEKNVKHYVNGRELSRERLVYDQPLKLGSTEIGNWGIPFSSANGSHSVRNFVGRIDSLTAWNAALSADEIREIFAKTRP